MIKLSIITINLNNAFGLKKTLASIAKQEFTDYEHIIVDGGSTDGSLEIIKDYIQRYNGVSNRLYWISEPDTGIYNAMNKGIKISKGEYIHFLNSGDQIASSEGIKKMFQNASNQDFICANSLLIFSSNKTKVVKFNPQMSFYDLVFRNPIAHSATFINKNLFSVIGLYNENYRIVSDWDFFLKAFATNHCSFVFIDIIFTHFEMGGLSNNPLNYNQLNKEREIVLSTYSFFMNDYNELHEMKQNKFIRLIYKFSKSWIFSLSSLYYHKISFKLKSILLKSHLR